MKKYVFKPYNKIFPELFEKEKKRLYIDGLLIEHIGSTAVPNLGGKGIIDIGIGADKKQFISITQHLQNLGYEFRPDFSTPDRLFFKAKRPDPEEGERTYHIHLLDRQCQEWKDLLALRDYLRAHPQEAREYEELKQKAVVDSNADGNKYRMIKDPHIRKILGRL